MSSHLRDFGLIRSTIWQSEKFCQLDDPKARLAYIWLHTSQKTCAGVLRIGPAHMADELDFVGDVDTAAQILTDLQSVGLIEWFKPFLVITKFVHASPIKSYRHAIGAFKECLGLPDSAAKDALFAQLKSQKGTQDLLGWRDKSGEPHPVVFQIHAYLEQEDSEPLVNSSQTPCEGFGRGSGILKLKHRKEKVENRQANDEGQDLTPATAPSRSAKYAENGQEVAMPRPETKAIVKRMGGI